MMKHILLKSFASNQKVFSYLLGFQKKLEINTVAFLLQCSDITNTTRNDSSFLSKVSPGTSDILENKLRKAQSFGNILQLISLHHSIMNNNHLHVTFSVLYDLAKKQSRIDALNMTKNTDFEHLCNCTLKLVRHFKVDEVITIIKTLSYFNVSSETLIMQCLFKMVQHDVNNLPLSQINFLIFILEKQHKTPLTEALLIALPLVLQSQIDLQIDTGNVSEMVECLSIATKKHLDDSCIEKLIKEILPKVNELSLKDAFTIVMRLAPENKYSEISENLLAKSLEIVSQNIENLSDAEIKILIYQMNAYSLYNKLILSSLSRISIEKKWDLSKLNYLLQLYIKYEFISYEILDYVVKIIKNNPTEVINDSRISVLNVVEYFALIGHQSSDIRDALKILTECKTKLDVLEKNCPLLFLKFVSHLAQFGCHPLSTVFGKSILSEASNYIKKCKIRFLQELCIIEWSTKLLQNDYNGPYLPHKLFQDVISRIWKEQQNKNFILKPFLKAGLGGSQYFQTNIMTRYGHTIDYLIAMMKGGYPMPISKPEYVLDIETERIITEEKAIFVEDLVIPKTAKLIAIIAADKSYYCQGCLQLKGNRKFELDILSKLDYHVLLVNLESWKSLLDHEKIPYLMRGIDEALKNENKENPLYLAI